MWGRTGRNVTAVGESYGDKGKAKLEKDIGLALGLPRFFSGVAEHLPCLSVPPIWALWLLNLTLAT